MDKNIVMLWEKLEEKLNQQTLTITSAVTTNVMEAINNKMDSIIQENKKLKTQITKLEQKLDQMEIDKRKKNLVFFGVEEKGKRESELVDYIKEIITDTGLHLDSQEISNVYRIGAQTNKNRPVVVSLTTIWKKHLILKNKSSLPSGIYVKEDYPKHIIETRKQLQPKVEEERNKGNFAYIKYDKLIVKKPNDPGREKRKREQSDSPISPTQKRSNPNKATMPTATNTKDVIKPNLLNYIARGRSSSLSEVSKNN
ncbi:unnamed protein product [Pieris macdunnoughi]|uniref:Endonuclease-reverse transcriptase n=1 Tax=Pieris macdunnoughi TaxID=345717 RepID=A0A821VY78_9NEOP|nr:unnamed protein product [Pieris macdunnoughi]